MSFGGSGSGSGSIAGADDVSLSNPASSQVLIYNTTSQKWVNADPEVTTADLTTQIASVTADMNTAIAAAKTSLNTEINSVNTNLSSEITTVKTDLTAAIAAVPGATFDLSHLTGTFALRLQSLDVTTIQAIQQDSKGYWWYNQITVATTGNTVEDTYIVRCSPGGTLLDYMTCTAGGHGCTLGIEYDVNGNPVVYFVWTDDAGSSQDLVSFPYAAGTVLTRTNAAVTKVWSGPMGFVGFNFPADLCVFRYPGSGSTATTELRKISEVKAGTNNVLKTITLPSNPSGSGFTFQGITTDADYCYLLTGIKAPEPSLITRYSWASGAQVDQLNVGQFGTVPGGTVLNGGTCEPEGITFTTDAGGGAVLVMGVSTGGRDTREILLYAFSQTRNDTFFGAVLDEQVARQPFVRRTLGTAFSTANNVYTVVNYDTSLADDSRIAWDATNFQFIMQMPGRYMAAIDVRWDIGPTDGLRYLRTSINGTGYARGQGTTASSLAGTLSQTVLFTIVTPGTTVQFSAYQACGGTVTLSSSSNNENSVSITRLGP